MHTFKLPIVHQGTWRLLRLALVQPGRWRWMIPLALALCGCGRCSVARPCQAEGLASS